MQSGGDATDRLESVFRAIAENARTVNLSRAGGLAQAVDSARSGRLAEADRLVAVQQAHQLAGSAGTFGFEEASAVAGQLEDIFAGSRFSEPDQLAAAQRLVERLQADLAGEPSYRADDFDADE